MSHDAKHGLLTAGDRAFFRAPETCARQISDRPDRHPVAGDAGPCAWKAALNAFDLAFDGRPSTSVAELMAQALVLADENAVFPIRLGKTAHPVKAQRPLFAAW